MNKKENQLKKETAATSASQNSQTLRDFADTSVSAEENTSACQKKYPEEFEKLFAVFEDEALNSQISPSLLSTYLKKRLGYSDASESTQTEVDTDKIKLIFDHDIFVDGE